MAGSFDQSKAVRFHVHLRLPAPDDITAAPLHIQSLSTSMPLFSHYLHELAGAVFFGQVALSATDASIEVEVRALRPFSYDM